MYKLTVELSDEQMEDFRSFLIGAIIQQKDVLKTLKEDSQSPDVEPDGAEWYEQLIGKREREVAAANTVLRYAYKTK